MPSLIHRVPFDEHLLQANALQKQVDEAKAAQDAYFAKARTDLEKIIRDKSIPLMDRWEFFQDAPDQVKWHLSYVYAPKTRSLRSLIEQHLEGSGRNTTLETSNALEGVDGDLRNNPDAPFWWDKSTRVADALEEIMEKNLGSFQLSW